MYYIIIYIMYSLFLFLIVLFDNVTIILMCGKYY